MQFRIRDVLTVTFIAALSLFAMERRRLVGDTMNEVQSTKNENKSLASEIAGVENLLHDEDMRRLFCEQIERLGKSVQQHYEQIKLAVPTGQPKPASVWLQSVPVFDPEPGLRVWRGHVNVPRESPVFVSCEITRALIQDSKYKDAVWATHNGFSGSIPWSLRISPGDHVVEVHTLRTVDLKNWQSRFGLKQQVQYGMLLGVRVFLDDQQVFQSAHVIEKAKRLPHEVFNGIDNLKYPRYFKTQLTLVDTRWKRSLKQSKQEFCNVHVRLTDHATVGADE